LRTVAALVAGALLGTLAFAQAAASIGIGVSPFRPLGGNFFALQSGQARLLAKIGTAQSVEDGLPLISFAKAALRVAPLSATSAWVLGVGYQARGDEGKARRAMRRGAMITRREPRVQLWLANDALKSGDTSLALEHFDIMLRTNLDVAPRVSPELAKVLTIEAGRKAMIPYARQDNPWFSDFMTGAASLPDIAPMAEFLVERARKAPDGEAERYAYAIMLQRLASAQRYDLLLKVYPLLPGSNPGALRTLDVRQSSDKANYPPIDWDFGNSNDRGGTPSALNNGGQGIEFFAAPGTLGPAGVKLLAPGDDRNLHFRLGSRLVNPDATANFVATCVSAHGDGASRTSKDLTRAPLHQELVFALPPDCQLMRLEFRLGGGNGTEPATVFVEGLRLAQLH